MSKKRTYRRKVTDALATAGMHKNWRVVRAEVTPEHIAILQEKRVDDPCIAVMYDLDVHDIYPI